MHSMNLEELLACVAVASWLAPGCLALRNSSPISPFCDPQQRNYCENHVACPSTKTRVCGYPTPMSDRVQNVVLNAHNQCRNTVTNRGRKNTPGSAKQGDKIPQMFLLPSSADMSLMTWDIELAQVAHIWVATCVVEDAAANISQHHNASGEVRVMPRDDFKKIFCYDVTRFTVEGWIMIIAGENYTPLFRLWNELIWSLCANISTTLPEHYIESYRPPSKEHQFEEAGVCLLWAHSSRLGCAHRRQRGLAAGRSFVAMACLYAPSPLRAGRPVYRRGIATSQCKEPGAASDSRMFQSTEVIVRRKSPTPMMMMHLFKKSR